MRGEGLSVRVRFNYGVRVERGREGGRQRR